MLLDIYFFIFFWFLDIFFFLFKLEMIVILDFENIDKF